MKVLMFGWEFPPYINGGLGIASYEIVRALLKQQIDVHLILPTIARVKADALSLTYPTLDTHLLSIDFIDSILQPYMSAKDYQVVNSQENNGHYANDLFTEVARYAQQGAELAKSKEFDIIHVHDWLTVRAGLYAKHYSHKPLIFHVHSLEIDRAGEHPNQAIFSIEYEGLHAADRIITVSEFTKKSVCKHYGIHPDKVSVAYNGVPQEYLARDKRERILTTSKSVLFLGRLTHQKGPYYFMEAAHHILSVRQDIQFMVVGEGDMLPALKEHAQQFNMTEHIQFLGFLDRDKVCDVYRQSQVYVMPSVSEPFGLTALEALTLNVPLVLSKQSGVSEVLNHVLKVDFWDTQTMAKKIMALIDYPVLGDAILNDSQEDLATLTWERCAEQIICAYQGA